MKKLMLVCVVFAIALSGCSTGFGIHKFSHGVSAHSGVSVKGDTFHVGVVTGIGVEKVKRDLREGFEPLLLDEPLPPMFKAEEIKGIITGTILVWTDDSLTGQLLGERDWYIGDGASFCGHIPTKYLYAAVSIEELAVVKDKLYVDVGWPWIQACEERLIVSVWYDRNQRPFYALRLDHFDKFKDQIKAVHKGKLPWWVTRTEDDDPKEV